MSKSPSGRSPPDAKVNPAWIPNRPSKRGSEPARLGEVLIGAQELLAKRSGAAIARDEWKGIVGARIAGQTRVGKLYGKVLTLKVTSSSWSNELSLLKPELISKLQMAGHEITDLRLKVEAITAPKRRGWSAPSWQHPKPLGLTELPIELQQRLNDVDDPNLRAAIAEAARWSLSQKKSDEGL